MNHRLDFEYDNLSSLQIISFLIYLHSYWLDKDYSEFTQIDSIKEAEDHPKKLPDADKTLAGFSQYLSLDECAEEALRSLVPTLSLNWYRDMIRQYCEKTTISLDSIFEYSNQLKELVTITSTCYVFKNDTKKQFSQLKFQSDANKHGVFYIYSTPL